MKISYEPTIDGDLMQFVDGVEVGTLGVKLAPDTAKLFASAPDLLEEVERLRKEIEALPIKYIRGTDAQYKQNRRMMNREDVAVNVLRFSLEFAPTFCLLGDIMACEIADLASSAIDTCPYCGSTAWVNIDCVLCQVVSSLRNGEMP